MCVYLSVHLPMVLIDGESSSGHILQDVLHVHQIHFHTDEDPQLNKHTHTLT